MTKVKYDPNSPVPKSTQWARANKEVVRQRDLKRKGTLTGKLTNLVTQSKYRAKTSGKSHNINTDYLRGLYEGQEGRCAISGIEMSIRGTQHSSDYWYSISIDRIDSTKGYVKGNVQLTCTGINRMKCTMTDEQFIEICKCVAERFK